MTTPWSDTPPSEPGWYWVLGNHSGEEWPMELCADGVWAGRVDMVQFGPRVLSAEDTVKLTAEVERLRQTLREYCDDDEVSSGFGSGCYSRRQIDEIRKRHGLDTESGGA